MLKISQRKKKRLVISLLILICLVVLVCLLIFFPTIPAKVSGLFKSVNVSKSNEKPEPTGTPSTDDSSEKSELRSQQEDTVPKSATGITGFPYVSDGLVETDAKEIIFDCINLNDRLVDGVYADIRIRYPNGEEYTVIRQARVIRTSTDDKENVYLCLTETESLYISSARADCEKYKGTYLYTAAGHVKPESAGCVGNYRPSKDVLTLINEEELMEKEKVDEVFLARERLEERLLHAYSGSVVYDMNDFMAEINDKLPGGLQQDASGGYWVYE